jgi:myo-inositol-1(or 4)-monophosphatase
MCCISIALIYEKEITLGVINDFNRGSLYEGSKDSRAKLNGADIFVSSIHDKSNATLATGLPAKGNFNKESMSELSNELVSWKKVRMIGSAAMSCAYVASGQFDQYQEKGIFLWDIAAGLSIIKAAGGNYTFKSYPEDQFKVDVVANNNCL